MQARGKPSTLSRRTILAIRSDRFSFAMGAYSVVKVVLWSLIGCSLAIAELFIKVDKNGMCMRVKTTARLFIQVPDIANVYANID